MSARQITVDCVKGKLGPKGRNWQLWHDGVLLYQGLWPIYDGARAMVDNHGYQLDDVVTLRWPDGSITPPGDLNSRYWIQVRESDRGGLQRFQWSGMTQEAIGALHGARKDALEAET